MHDGEHDVGQEGPRSNRTPTHAWESAQPEECSLFPSTGSARMANRWLRILQWVTEGAIAHLDLQALLRELLGRIREAMAVDNAAILLVSEDNTHLTLYAAHGPEEDVTGQVQVPMGRGVAGSIAASAQPRIIDDLSQVDVENPLLRATAHSLLGVPLLSQTRVIGVLHVDSARPRHFTDEDSQLLQVLASRVVLAIEHAQLYESQRVAREEAEGASRQLQALQAISDVALEHVRLDDLLQALLLRIQQMLGVDNVAILLPTTAGQELTLYSVRGPEEAMLGKVHVPMGQGVAGTIAATRAPLIVDNLATVPVANPFLRKHFRSLMGVPLLDDGRLVGVIHVDSVAPRQFTEEESHLLQVLAERIARAIARAQQYEHVRQSRTQAEREVAALQETTQRMDAFLSVASHELKTPVTSMKASVQLAMRAARSLSALALPETAAAKLTRALELLASTDKQATKLDRLIDDLLDVTRLQAGTATIRLARADLGAIVREAIEQQQLAWPGRAIRLDLSSLPEALPTLMVDADRVSQVVANFLTNALKYSADDAPVTVTITFPGRDEPDQQRDQVRVAVRDQGPGLSAEQQVQLWQLYHRVPDIVQQSGSGAGLGIGLYVCKAIVEQHGGRVGVESAPGEGSMFWFTLPAPDVPPADSMEECGGGTSR